MEFERWWGGAPRVLRNLRTLASVEPTVNAKNARLIMPKKTMTMKPVLNRRHTEQLYAVEDMWLKEGLPRQDFQILLTKLIERVPVFAGFTQAELLELLTGAEKRVFMAGDAIISEGNSGCFMYVMVEGQASAFKRGNGRKIHNLGMFGSGDCFGEMALVDRAPRSATVEAVKNCVLIRIQESDCWSNPVISSKIFRNIAGILAQRLREVHGMVLASGAATD